MARWEGDERRSADSVLARTAVSAKEEAEALQATLEQLPGRRFRRRARVSRSLEDARRREREALAMLQANRAGPERGGGSTSSAGVNSAT
ncbi:MAG: hypothetical protein ABR581_06510 [Thermoleophilaceae bacterium]